MISKQNYNTLKNALLLLFLPLLMGSNCRDDCNEPIPYYPLDKDFLSYCVFPAGSWWVYKEEKSEKTDSTYILSINSKNVKNFLGRGCNAEYESERIAISKVINGDTLIGSAKPQVSKKGVEYYLYHQGNGEMLFKIVNNSLGKDTLTKEVIISKRYDNLIIEDSSYNEIIVVKFITATEESQGKFLKEIYYSKNVGVILKKYTDSSKMKLTRYKINN